MTTLERLKAWLIDPNNIHAHRKLPDDMIELLDKEKLLLPETVIRKRFVTTNGIEISIQQSAMHYCRNTDEVEMWCCPHRAVLDPYGTGEDPYSYVPLEVVAAYVDELESEPCPSPSPSNAC
jgi:hypothetical protein